MSVDERVRSWLFPAALATFLAGAAVAVAIGVHEHIPPFQLALWFVAGLINGAIQLLVFRPGQQRKRVLTNVVAFATIWLVLLYQSANRSASSLLCSVGFFAALVSGMSLLFCFFRKKFAQPAILEF